MKLGTKIPIHIPAAPIALPKGTATLVNISEVAFYAERTFGSYRIEGCQKGEPYTVLVISGARAIIDMGDRIPGKLQGTRQEPIEAMAIGEDLVRCWNGDLWGLGSTPTGEVANEAVHGFAGVFVSDFAEPSAEELAQAHEIFALSDRALAECAHRDWDQFHRPDMIHGGWKRAMRRLGVDAEFLYTVSNIASLPDCPFCGSKMKTATATVCATCHRDVNPNGPQSGAAASPATKPPVRKRSARPNTRTAPTGPAGGTNAAA